MKKMIPFLMFLLIVGCDRNLSGPTVNENGVKITPGDDSLTISNTTKEELRFFIVNQVDLALINWAPYCLDSGLVIPKDGKATVAYDAIYGYVPGCKIVVNWWACHQVDGTKQPGDIQNVVVQSGGE